MFLQKLVETTLVPVNKISGNRKGFGSTGK